MKQVNDITSYEIIDILNRFSIKKPILDVANKMDFNLVDLFYDKVFVNSNNEKIDEITKNLLGIYGNFLATYYFKQLGYNIYTEVPVYDGKKEVTKADLSFIDSSGKLNYCEVKAAFQIIDNMRNYKDSSPSKTGCYKDLDTEIIKYKNIGKKLITQVDKLSKTGAVVNVIIFDGCFLDEIIKQNLNERNVKIIKLAVNIYDLEKYIKDKVIKIQNYYCDIKRSNNKKISK